MKSRKLRRRLLLVSFEDKLTEIVQNELPSLFEPIFVRSMEELELISHDQNFTQSVANDSGSLTASTSELPPDIVIYALRNATSDELKNVRTVRRLLPNQFIYLFSQNVSIPLLRVALQEKIAEVFMYPLNDTDKQNFYHSLDKNRIVPAELLTELSDDNDNEVRSLQSNKYSPVVDLLNNIEANYQTGTSIQSFSGGIALSISRLCHMFKEFTGMTCSQYLICRKLEEAEHLLSLNQVPVTSISYQLGFANPPHFSRTFKEHFGVTPTTFAECGNNLKYSAVFTCFQKVRMELFPSLYKAQAQDKDYDHAFQSLSDHKRLQA